MPVLSFWELPSTLLGAFEAPKTMSKPVPDRPARSNMLAPNDSSASGKTISPVRLGASRKTASPSVLRPVAALRSTVVTDEASNADLLIVSSEAPKTTPNPDPDTPAFWKAEAPSVVRASGNAIVPVRFETLWNADCPIDARAVALVRATSAVRYALSFAAWFPMVVSAVAREKSSVRTPA